MPYETGSLALEALDVLKYSADDMEKMQARTSKAPCLQIFISSYYKVKMVAILLSVHVVNVN